MIMRTKSRVKLNVCFAVSGLLASTVLASAADLPSLKEPAPLAPAAEDSQPFFVKVGAVYAVNTSFSRLAAQNPAALQQGDPQFPRGSVKIPRVWSLEIPPPDDRRQRR